MRETNWTLLTEHWYMCIGCEQRCKAIGFKHPMVQGDSCGGTLGRRQEIQVLLKNREEVFNELETS
jgi:hypothetical protein